MIQEIKNIENHIYDEILSTFYLRWKKIFFVFTTKFTYADVINNIQMA